MNKVIIGIVITLIALGGIIWVARPSAQNAAPSPRASGGTLRVEGESSYNFGSISMAAGTVSRIFTLRNTGTGALTIKKIYTSCMCTTALLRLGGATSSSGELKQFGPFGMPGHGAVPSINQQIGPNETATVDIVFDPAAHGPAGVGRIERVVTIENDAGDPVELSFSAQVTP